VRSLGGDISLEPDAIDVSTVWGGLKALVETRSEQAFVARLLKKVFLIVNEMGGVCILSARRTCRASNLRRASKLSEKCDEKFEVQCRQELIHRLPGRTPVVPDEFGHDDFLSGGRTTFYAPGLPLVLTVALRTQDTMPFGLPFPMGPFSAVLVDI